MINSLATISSPWVLGIYRFYRSWASVLRNPCVWKLL